MKPRLPGILGEIADVAGEAAALKLARERGGTEMKISGRAGGALALIVGDEAAAKIAELLGPEKYTIPMAHLRGQKGRHAAAARMDAQGASAAQIAKATDMHERSVYRLRDRKRNGPKLPLFDD